MSKVVKGMLTDAIRQQLGEARDLLVVDVSRIDAITTNEWRLAMQEREISVLTVRNTLARRALHEVGVTALDPFLAGPSTLVWGSEDIVALSREMTKWAKDISALEIKGAAVEGTSLDAAGVEALSKSPSREELISQLAGMLLSPGSQLAGALLSPGAQLASQISKISEGDAAEGGTAEE